MKNNIAGRHLWSVSLEKQGVNLNITTKKKCAMEALRRSKVGAHYAFRAGALSGPNPKVTDISYKGTLDA